MKEVKLLGNKKLKIIEIPKPEPNRGEVVIKVMASIYIYKNLLLDLISIKHSYVPYLFNRWMD